MRVLDVFINSKLTIVDHTDHLSDTCATSINALKMPRPHDLKEKHVIVSMTILTSLCPCCMHLRRGEGYTSAKRQDRIGSIG